ncbi:MAG: NAD(P)-binding domain-containing protein [Acidiferrobacterales bacterium]|nr:NAD(P)-binding domain-containing protein [Acidiferrobacterales bacterium]
MKILFADKFPSQQLEQLQGDGHQTSFQPDLQADDIPDAIAGFEVLVVRGTKVEKPALNAADQLKMVIRAGAGTNTIDKEAAKDKGIAVCNVPGKNAIAVAELALGLLLSIDRRIPDNIRELKAGLWNKKTFSNARGLFGRSIGIVGAGSIGMAVAQRASAFGLKVIMINKPGRSPELLQQMQALAVQTVDSLEQLVTESDIVSIHVPAAPGTKHLVNEEFLGWMREDAVLLNTSRGDVVDEQALLAALDSKGLRAGLDVYANEPGASSGEFNSQLARHPNVYGTHHIGASTDQAQDAVADGVIEIVNAFSRGDIINQVNQ